MQTPAKHSPPLQALPSSRSGLLHVPVEGLQAPSAWHSSAAVQTTRSIGEHTPSEHASSVVQGSPSSQVLPTLIAKQLVLQQSASDALPSSQVSPASATPLPQLLAVSVKLPLPPMRLTNR